jgi:hypothetical protein
MSNKLKLLGRGFSVNGHAELRGVVEVQEDGQLTGQEWSGNLSSVKQQQQLAQWIHEVFEVPLGGAVVLVRGLIKELQGRRSEAEQQSEESPSAPGKPEATAKFQSLVDLVATEAGVEFLVLEEGNLVTHSQVVVDGTTYVPPPADAIQWLLPQASNAIASFTQDSDRDIYFSVKDHLRSVSQLPTEGHYCLLALWVVHTYLLERFSYSPYLLLWAVPERGKSRTAKAATCVAYRGLLTETLQEANLFRWSNDLGASLALDVRDLWRKAEKRGSDDTLLQRFEKGAKVARVLWPERGKFKDTRYFDVFGASIIAANEMPGEPFISRCIVVTMPEATTQFPNNVDPQDGLPLRERLVGLRARCLNKPLPDAAKPTPGRLGDILQPFAQVAALLGPDVQEEFAALAKTLYAERMEDQSASREAQMVVAVETIWDVQEDGKIGTEAIASQYNLGLSEKNQLSPDSLGRRLRALGFQRARLKDGSRAIVADAVLLEALKIKYGLTLMGNPRKKLFLSLPWDTPRSVVKAVKTKKKIKNQVAPRKCQKCQKNSGDDPVASLEINICSGCRQSVPGEEVARYADGGEVLCWNCADEELNL